MRVECCVVAGVVVRWAAVAAEGSCHVVDGVEGSGSRGTVNVECLAVEGDWGPFDGGPGGGDGGWGCEGEGEEGEGGEGEEFGGDHVGEEDGFC